MKIKINSNCSHLVIPRLDRGIHNALRALARITCLDSGFRRNDGRVVTIKILFPLGLIAGLLLLAQVANAQVQSPVAVMQKVSNKMLSTLQKNKARLKEKGVLNKIVDQVLIPHVALDRMGASVVGRVYWISASGTQRKDFLNEFTRLIVSTYAAALASYDGDIVRFYPLRINYEKRRTIRVRSVIVRRNGQRIPMSYNLVRVGNAWKIYDFSIENISIVRSYQAQFSSVLANYGMKGLITRLREHNRRIR